MNILLDTHIFLWYLAGSERLSVSTQAFIDDPANDIYVSPVTVWEVIIKHSLGKIVLPESPSTYLPRQRERLGYRSLPIDEQSVARVATLPSIHRDPFDRLLIAQALRHNFVLATVDQAIRSYPVQTI